MRHRVDFSDISITIRVVRLCEELTMAEALDRRVFIRSIYKPEFVLDVEQKSTAPGAKIILWNQKKDSQARNQLFYIDQKSERIRSALNDFCLDIRLSGKKILVLNPYSEASKTQQWDVRGGYIRNITTRDLLGVPDIPNRGMDIIFSMYANVKQEWTMEPSVPCYISLHSQHNGKLLDVCQKKTDPGTQVIVWSADLFGRAKGNQQWFENTDGYICTMLNNYVIDIKDGSNKAIINPPDPENPWQKWTFSDGFIVNSVKGTHVLALDKNETDVIICEKDPSCSRQKWTLKYI